MKIEIVCSSETPEHLFTTIRCRNPKEFHRMKCNLLTIAFHVLGKLQETKKKLVAFHVLGKLQETKKNLSRVEKVFLCLSDMANI
jgi:hypothetical protein